jgi:hypothetical protein
MASIDLEPEYSGHNTSSKCVRCLAEQQLAACLRELLSNAEEDPVYLQQYEALAAFLTSPDAERMRIESESLLAAGRKVKLRIFYGDGKPVWELIVEGKGDDSSQ